MESPLVQSTDKILISKQKWTIVGLVITILNPIFAGLIYGVALQREQKLKKEGQLIVLLSLFWGAIQLALLARYY